MIDKDKIDPELRATLEYGKGGQCSITSAHVLNHDGHDCVGFRVVQSKWKPGQ